MLDLRLLCEPIIVDPPVDSCEEVVCEDEPIDCGENFSSRYAGMLLGH